MNYGHLVGIEKLPDSLFSKEFCYPCLNYENIWGKTAAAESLIQEHGLDISFNIYIMASDKVHNSVLRAEKTVTISRLISSVSIYYNSETSRARNHNSSYNFLINQESADQFHCSDCLDIGKFVYHNEERFYYDKGPEELTKMLSLSVDSLTGPELGGEEKVLTGSSRHSKFRALNWQTVFTCNACLTGFLKKVKFQDHILGCVGGHVSRMNFSTILQIEHFEEWEYPNTLLCPIIHPNRDNDLPATKISPWTTMS